MVIKNNKNKKSICKYKIIFMILLVDKINNNFIKNKYYIINTFHLINKYLLYVYFNYYKFIY